MKYYLSFLLFALVTVSVGCTTAPETVAKNDHHQSSKSEKAQEKNQGRAVAQSESEALTGEDMQLVIQRVGALQTDLTGARETDDGKLMALLSEDSIETFAALGVGVTAGALALRTIYRNLRQFMRIARAGAFLAGTSIIAGISFTYLQKKHPDGVQNFIILTKDNFTSLWNLTTDIQTSVSNRVIEQELGLGLGTHGR